MMLPSAVSNLEQKNYICITLGNVSTTKPTVLLIFVLGKGKDTFHQTLAQTENSINYDILFEDILEKYENL